MHNVVQLTPIFPLINAFTPELDIDMVALLVLRLLCNRLASHRDRLAVKVAALLNTSKLKERRYNVRVRGDHIDRLVFRDVGAAQIEWHIDVLFESAGLSGLEPMLADMIAVIGSEYLSLINI